MFLHVLRIIFILLEVVVLFNLLIVVHELGHFLAARWRGLVIEKFGVRFGKPLWKKTINGVEYSLGSVPLGGFVALPQLAPMDIIEGETETDRAQLPPDAVRCGDQAHADAVRSSGGEGACEAGVFQDAQRGQDLLVDALARH